MLRESSQISLEYVFEFISAQETVSQGCMSYSAFWNTATRNSPALLAQGFSKNIVSLSIPDSEIQSKETYTPLANGYQYMGDRINWKRRCTLPMIP